ncbi:TetR/AcrR family transcriptional regulator [Nocardioides dongkuii]|uniref:TetR/AcrR family transcriptional regulator n=1 Tax=Nocardioides dongkuii TaxID=2760089 RepID=UPI0015F7C1E2|nr:TetR/AcrR family transcriptional regulator [Nocardioides dongkuii]
MPPEVNARDRLLAAAVEAFSARGFHGTTTRDIAAAAGMSPAALYVHHRSKEELLHLICLVGHQRVLALCEDAVAGPGTPVDHLARLVEEFVRHHAVHHVSARVVTYEMAALTEEHRAEVEELRRRIDRVMRDLLERGAASGHFTTTDPAITATALLSLGIDVARWYREDRGWSPDLVAEHYRGLALRMVGAA